MRQIFALAILGALVLFAIGCSNLEKAVIGKYQLNIDSSAMKAEEKAQVDMASALLSQVTLDIQEDHKAEMSAMGQNKKGTWKLEGDKLTVTPEGDKAAVFVVKDGGKTLEADAKEMGIPGDLKGAVISFKKTEAK